MGLGLDMTKWAGQVRVWSIGFAGQLGRGSSRVMSWVEFTRIFQTNFFFFFFFEIDAICQLFLSSLIVIRFSLVVLLPLTNYH